ncbi:putative alpha-1,2-mannosidase [Anseongella ginsenosidimutans]|uniref:Putative alpha-1,2-mannosidase n=1 Tax=Anseongella ginsenosidimutans TaxID=496056 RepID=A0A4R3KT83_9SPHI|nr:GH92 family glycosyl hydrolase [Anseongella ginsenosidimutans]QEC53103.1 glycoside hydrolase family 92 protein [Anseongella ginsenosidimutans]TCS87721.1 putative alpha-1,2-mannosidase [Anseongella ginsenosidimutans]
MRKILTSGWVPLLGLFLLAGENGAVAQSRGEDLTAFVDPLIGTAHCRWFHFAPGSLPFGMAKPGPATNGHYGNPSGWEAVGYDYRHESIEGFPNFHEFQVGGVVFAPVTGELETIPGKLENPDKGYRSRFSRENEVATAGYYSVLLDEYRVKAEVTATPRVAFHRYTFPASQASHILFDIGNQQGESGPVKDARVYLTPEGRVEGFVTTLPAYVQKYQPGAEVSMYFSAVLDKKPVAYGVFRGEEIYKGREELSGKGAGLYLSFSTAEGEAVTIKAGLSYTSIENARLNLEAEAKNLDFDGAHQRASDTWNSYLGRIHVETPVREDKVKFYTGLYHALLGRGLASDVNGAYPKNDGSIGQIPLDEQGRPLFHHYNTDAMWGAYWNLTQLWALAYPEYYSDFIKSQLLVYKDAGWLGDGIASSRFVSGVGTNFMSLVIASAFMCGIRDFDIEQGYQAALKNETGWENRPRGAGKLDVDRFVKYGFVNHLDQADGPDEAWRFSGSHTLEYSFSSFAVAQWAKLLGKEKDYAELMRLSNGWEKIYDPSTGFMRPRYADGSFLENFRPEEVWRGFQEGNAWQYTFFVPHEPESLVEKLGRQEFNSRLDSIFTVSQKAIFGGGRNIDAFAGLEGLYNHGNQPNLHISWMFNYSGKPSLTQKWVRAICNEFYGTEGVHGYGYGQDEDQGQLGAWYVISSIGLFDVKGLTETEPRFGLGSPLFDKVTILLNQDYYKGKKFVIETRNNSPQNQYVQSFHLNGKALQTPFIPFRSITKGGKLTLQMGETPKDNYKK